MLSDIFCYLRKNSIEYKTDFPLSKITPIKIGAAASLVIYPHKKEELLDIVSLLADKKAKFIVVGKMTNILPSDEHYKGAVVSTVKMKKYSADENICTAECGVPLSKMIFHMAENSFGGAEGLSMIPGTVGGALCGNAGAFGSEISHIFCEGEFFNINSKKIQLLKKDELELGYRSSAITKKGLVFLSGSFKFKSIDKELVMNKISEFKKIRLETQPFSEHSLGSIFKRTESIGAGYYIEKAGLKGFSVGGAEISKKHAGFIVNTDNASASDVKKLIEIIKERVFTEFSVELEEEIKIM